MRSPASARTKTHIKSRRCQTSPRRLARSLEARYQAASKTPFSRRISGTSAPRHSVSTKARRRCVRDFACCLTSPSPEPSSAPAWAQARPRTPLSARPARIPPVSFRRYAAAYPARRARKILPRPRLSL